MKTISLQQNYSKPIVLCLGFFDCMHLGHIKLLQTAKNIANGAEVALFTFRNNHFETLKRPSKLLFTFDERIVIYESLGVDLVVSALFDESFRALSGEEFLAQIARLNVVGIVCGADYTCGCDLLTAQGVRSYFAPKVPVEIVDIMLVGDHKIGSSLVRDYICKGNVAQANSLLSQPYFFMGEVVQGRHVGRGLGFPTVNVAIPDEKIAPFGVYSGKVDVDGTTYSAVVNVGMAPTFGVNKPIVEAHLLDFDGDLYGKTVKISITRFLRPIRKFEDGAQLSAQLDKDIQAVKND